MNSLIAAVVIGLPVEGPFDYLIPENLSSKIRVGARVLVPFGPRRTVGYVVGLPDISRFSKEKLKSVITLLDPEPLLDAHLLELTRRVAEYFACGWGEVLDAALPEPLRRGQETDWNTDLTPREAIISGPLEGSGGTAEQIPVLIHDPDGQKSREYLFEEIRQARRNNQGVIVLVPETSMIKPLVQKIQAETAAVADGFVPQDKGHLQLWKKIFLGEVGVVVGSRSAVFAPVKNLGLIIVLDEENSAYKQEQSPHYHAREVALLRSSISGAKAALVSACPSLESVLAATKKKIKRLDFPSGTKTVVQLVDLSNYKSVKMGILSVPLCHTIERTLSQKGRVVLYFNRRGFSTLAVCEKCHFVLKCPRCDTNLAYLFSHKKMACGRCNYRMDPPPVCPKCHVSSLRFGGVGIEKLESEMARLFPSAVVSRLDKDTHLLKTDFDILIATQAVLKHYRDLKAKVVGVLNIDAELNRPDLYGAHRVFATLTHLKAIATEKMIVQTRLPDNDCLRSFAKDRSKTFYRRELKSRKELDLPPFTHLITVGLRGPAEALVRDQAGALFGQLKKAIEESQIKMDILDPHSDFQPKLRDQYRFNILLKAGAIRDMLSVVRPVLRGSKRKFGVIVSVNVDP